VRGNPQALFGKRPTEKDPAKGTSPAVDFTREEAAAEKDQFTWHLARRPTSPTSAQPGMTLGVLFSYSP
jgi:hypothetical protein